MRHANLACYVRLSKAPRQALLAELISQLDLETPPAVACVVHPAGSVRHRRIIQNGS